MRISTFIASPVALLALVQAALAATIESPPSLVQCQPAAITWSGAPAGQIFLSVIPGGQASAAALQSFPTQNGASGSYTWTVNLPAGTSVTLKLVDSTGATAYSSPVTIQAGSTTDCGTQAAGAASGGASSSIAAQSSSISSASSTAAAGASSVASSAASSVSSASSSLSASSAGIASSASSAVKSVASAASSAGASITSAAGSAVSAAGSSATSAAGTGAASHNKAAVSAVLLGAAGILAALMA